MDAFDMAYPAECVLAGVERILATLDISSADRSVLRSVLIQGYSDQVDPRKNARAIERVLPEPWSWSWLDEKRAEMDALGLWPRAWDDYDLNPLFAPEEMTKRRKGTIQNALAVLLDRTVNVAIQNELRNRQVRELVAQNADFPPDRQRELVITVFGEDDAERHYAIKYMAGRITTLPPFFPGDSCQIDTMKSSQARPTGFDEKITAAYARQMGGAE